MKNEIKTVAYFGAWTYTHEESKGGYAYGEKSYACGNSLADCAKDAQKIYGGNISFDEDHKGVFHLVERHDLSGNRKKALSFIWG